ETGDEGLERLAELSSPGGAQRTHRPPMESPHRGDDLRAAGRGRANLIAASTASEPELLRKTRFRFDGATESNFSTKAAFASVPNEGPTWMSSWAWRMMASTIAGLQWPRFPTPKDAPQSMYSL